MTNIGKSVSASKNILSNILRCYKNGIMETIIPKKKFSTTSVRKWNMEHDKHEPYTNVGFNLPFSVENRYKLLAKTILYWGTAFGYPFFCIHMIKIKSS